MIDLNLLGVLYCTHAALPAMVEQGSGHIVNVSSVAGRTARAGTGVYNLTKWGVGAFSESLRQEVTERNVRVTLIEPGAVDTELFDHNRPDRAAEIKALITDTLVPDDIARSIVFVLSQPDRVSVNELLIRPTGQAR